MRIFIVFVKRLLGIEKQFDSDTQRVMIVGLGNPGREYRENRHNVGFMVIDALAEKFGITPGKVKSKAILGEGRIDSVRVVLVKPQTFMNLSGQAVASLVKFYKIPLDRMIVIHDDLDLPLGILRLRPGGGSGGQKGIASIIERLGTQDFPRMRVGIGRPPGRMDPADYVLQDFSKQDKEELTFLFQRAVDAVEVFSHYDLQTAMNQFNGSSNGGDKA